MRKIFVVSFLLLRAFAFSQPANNEKPEIDPTLIKNSLMNWLIYQRDHIIWSADYISLDLTGNKISKETFLDRLTTGKFLPVKIRTKDPVLCYQLYEMDTSVDKDIINTIKNSALLQLQYYRMEGTSLPGFNFTDLNNNIYNNETTKGKILVLNCWFIKCQPCVAEMPGLNRLVKKFEKRKDLFFLGLAFDASADLVNFLKQTTFRYAVVPGMEDYLRKELRIVSYPTHILVNREGKIVKIIPQNINELSAALEKELK